MVGTRSIVWRRCFFGVLPNLLSSLFCEVFARRDDR